MHDIRDFEVRWNIFTNDYSVVLVTNTLCPVIQFSYYGSNCCSKSVCTPCPYNLPADLVPIAEAMFSDMLTRGYLLETGHVSGGVSVFTIPR